MPAKESAIHSYGAPQTYRLKTGGEVVLRNGCLYRGSTLVASNGSAVAWLLKHAELTSDQAYWLPYVIDANSRTVSSVTHVNAGMMPGGPIK